MLCLVQPIVIIIFVLEEVSREVIGYTDTWRMLKSVNVRETLGLNEFEIFSGVLVLLVWLRVEVQLLVVASQLVVVVQWQVVVKLDTEANASLVSPAPGDVLDRVPASTEDEQWQIPVFDDLNTLAMASQSRVVSA